MLIKEVSPQYLKLSEKKRNKVHFTKCKSRIILGNINLIMENTAFIANVKFNNLKK
jgi:hypothetical protein